MCQENQGKPTKDSAFICGKGVGKAEEITGRGVVVVVVVVFKFCLF